MEALRQLAAASWADLRSRGFWRAMVAEIVGTFILVFFAAITAVDVPGAPLGSFDAKLMRNALASGCIVSTLIWSLGHISGAHVNPAVSVALAATGKISVIRAILYVPLQFGGGIGAGMLLKLLSPPLVRNGSVGINEFDAEQFHPVQAYGVEFMLTLALMLPIMATTDALRFDRTGPIPIVIGLQVMACISAGGGYSGASMNPARSLGPAIAAGKYQQLWVHVAGPFSGALTSALLYQFLFRGKYMQPESAGKPHGNEVFTTEL